MHFRRRRRRELGARGHSSDWRYPQIEKGSEKRGLPSTRRLVTAFEQDFQRWMEDPEFADAYREARARIDAADTLAERNRDLSGSAG